MLLAGACAVGAGRAPLHDETGKLKREVRALKQEILAFKPGRKDADVAAKSAHPILAKLASLIAEMTTGKHKAAAAELLLESPSVRDSDSGVLDCVEVKKSFEDKALDFWSRAMEPGDCGFLAISDLMTAAISGAANATGDALKTRVEKVRSMEGATNASSCGKESIMAILSGLSRKWSNAKGISACTDGGGNLTTPFLSMLTVGTFADLICLKDGADYCLATGSSLVALQIANPATKESLDRQCSPCTMKALKIMA